MKTIPAVALLLFFQTLQSGNKDVVEVLTVTNNITTYVMARSPSADCAPMVTRNGLVLAEGIDYSRADRIITFNENTTSTPTNGDIVTVRYR